MDKKRKFIFITGGVASGIGKGITGSSIARMIKQKGLKVTMQKLDPYINVDASLINPREHGEVFVTSDGYECDLDLGHYERYLEQELTNESSITTGRIYRSVIEKERNGKFQGKTIQVVPHIIDEIKQNIYDLFDKSAVDVSIVEIGGIVGDIESQPFYEAIRQIKNQHPPQSVLFVHCTYLPFLETSQEYKTKPTQNSVALLNNLGIQPDLIVARSRGKIPSQVKEKIALFTNVKKECVVEAKDQKIIFELVNDFYKQKIDQIICHHLGFKNTPPQSKKWDELLAKVKRAKGEVKVAIVGKYDFKDAYFSVIEALKSACHYVETKCHYQLLYSKEITSDNVKQHLQDFDAILIPGGFGHDGVEGKLLAIQYARESKVPLLGICYGMQLSVIEYARNVLQLKNAHSTEIDPQTKYPVIDIISSKSSEAKAGILRLGSNECHILKNSKTYDLYKKQLIHERHRHKYEFTSLTYDQYFKNSDIVYTGFSNSFEFKLIEIIEMKNHPFFVGCQFHPEFLSTFTKPSPLYLGLVQAAIAKRDNKAS